MDRGSVYWAKPDGSEIKEVIHPIMTPNGIGLSPDENFCILLIQKEVNYIALKF